MTREQGDRLAALMAEGRSTRPEGVLCASLAQAPAPRGTELMRKVGVEPAVTTFEILELG